MRNMRPSVEQRCSRDMMASTAHGSQDAPATNKDRAAIKGADRGVQATSEIGASTMKREHLLANVEKAVGRAMRDLVRAHPQALQGYVARSIEKRLIGMLGSEMLRAMGHPPDTGLRAPGECYKPSQAAREMQRAGNRSAKGQACTAEGQLGAASTTLALVRSRGSSVSDWDSAERLLCPVLWRSETILTAG